MAHTAVGQSYIMGISQALLFAQEHFTEREKLVDINNKGVGKTRKKSEVT